MWFLTIITYFALIVQLLFVTISIGTLLKKSLFIITKLLFFLAAGLYYLAELVEEYTAFAKKCIWWTNLVNQNFVYTLYGTMFNMNYLF